MILHLITATEASGSNGPRLVHAGTVVYPRHPDARLIEFEQDVTRMEGVHA
jgi:hypothetical protein